MLAGVLLVLWLVVVIYQSLRPPYNYEPTGDELFDRLAILMLEQYYANKPGELQILLSRYFGGFTPEEWEFDYSEILDWQEEFGDDPRYWQLAKAASVLGGAKQADHWTLDYETNEEGERWTFDYEAREEWELQVRHRFALILESGLEDVHSYTLIPWSKWILSDEEDRTLELVDRAIVLDPENSYYYYHKADLLLTLGELEDAWEQVRLGNATPRNYMPAAFPLGSLQNYYSGFTTKNSRLAAVLIRAHLTSDAVSTMFPVAKDKYKEVELCLALGAPMELADDYLVRAKRMGQMEDQTLHGQIISAVLARILIDAGDEFIWLTPQQRKEFLHLSQELEGQFKEHEALIQQNITFFLGTESPADFLGPPYWSNLTRENWLGLWPSFQQERELVEQGYSVFDMLDPPPLVRWARGELVFEGHEQ